MTLSSGYIPLVEVLKKWDCEENEVIKWGAYGELYLWCFKAIPPSMEKKWCIVGNAINFIQRQPSKRSIFTCIWHDAKVINSSIYVKPENCTPDDLSKTGSWERINMEVDRSDLHLDRDEIARMEQERPGLVGKEIKNERDTVTQEESNNTKQLNFIHYSSKTILFCFFVSKCVLRQFFF